jgi:hypothetical protein
VAPPNQFVSFGTAFAAAGFSPDPNLSPNNQAFSNAVLAVCSRAGLPFGFEAANVVLAGPTSGASALPAYRTIVAADLPGSFAGFANPSAKIALAAVNGTSTFALRADAAQALDQSIAPTWTGQHTFTDNVFNAISIKGDSAGLSWSNTAGTEVIRITTVKGWTGAGVNVTDAVVGTRGVLNLYAGNSSTATVSVSGPSVGALVAITTTNARGTGNAYIQLIDPTGTKGYFGYTGASDDLDIVNVLAGQVRFWTNNTNRGNIASSGGWTIAAPTSGIALSITGIAAQTLSLGSTATYAGYLELRTNGSNTSYILTDGTAASTNSVILQAGGGSASYGGGLVLYAAGHATHPGDVWIGTASGGGQVRFGAGGIGPGTEFAHFASTGALTINAPTAGTALAASGVDGAYVATFVGPTGSTQRGVEISAGTTSTDISFIVTNQAASAILFEIFGDGHGTLGPSGSLGLSWTTAGAVIVATPSSGNIALSVTGVAGTRAVDIAVNSGQPGLRLHGGGAVGANPTALLYLSDNQPLLRIQDTGASGSILDLLAIDGTAIINSNWNLTATKLSFRVNSIEYIGISTAGVVSQNSISFPTTAVLGDLWYASSTTAISRLAGTTSATKQFLIQTGTGAVSAAPAWGTIATGDLPANGGNPTATVGTAAVNGSATTWMRSDGAPAIDLTMAPTWTGQHAFNATSAAVVIGTSSNTSFLDVRGGTATSVVRIGSIFSWLGSGSTSDTAIGAHNNLYIYTGNSVTQIFAVLGTTAPTLQGYGPTAAALVDMTPDNGTFTMTLTGCTTSPTGIARWSRIGNVVIVRIPSIVGTSNSTSMTMTGIPAVIQSSNGAFLALPSAAMENNTLVGGAPSEFSANPVTNTLTFYVNGSSTGWFNSGTKGVSSPIWVAWTLF